MRGISSVPQDLLASQDGLCSVELVEPEPRARNPIFSGGFLVLYHSQETSHWTGRMRLTCVRLFRFEHFTHSRHADSRPSESPQLLGSAVSSKSTHLQTTRQERRRVLSPGDYVDSRPC